MMTADWNSHPLLERPHRVVVVDDDDEIRSVVSALAQEALPWTRVVEERKTLFHGETVDELARDFHAAVDHYLDNCKRAGREPQKPASGS